MESHQIQGIVEAYNQVVENQQLDESMASASRTKEIKDSGGFDRPPRSREFEKRLPTPRSREFEKRLPKPTGGSASSVVKSGGQVQHMGRDLKNSADLFDIVKGHLIDEGYADTEEAALAIMANMSEEWRESIVEAIGGPIGSALKAYSKAARPLFSGLPRGRTVDADKAFKAGGGNAKMKQTGMGRAEVQRLGAKNMGK